MVLITNGTAVVGLAFAGYGQQLHAPNTRVVDASPCTTRSIRTNPSRVPVNSQGILDPLKSLVRLVLAHQPLAAFNLQGVACARRTRPRMQRVLCSAETTTETEAGPVSLPAAHSNEEGLMRVCTFGGCGQCSAGLGDAALDQLQFMSPLQGPKVVSSSCLARCDHAVAVKTPSGEVAVNVNSVKACSLLLQKIGCSVDDRLMHAYSAERQAKKFAAQGQNNQALTSYRRAFSLAIAGLGIQDKSQTSPLIRLFMGSEANMVRDGAGRGELVIAAGLRTAAEFVTPAQFRWFARALIQRSRLYSSMAPPTETPRRRVYASRRALVDAKCAIQMAQIFGAEDPESASAEPILLEAWERLAESYEGTSDIDKAIYAYEQLLALEPPSTKGLSPTIAAKRGAQELVLASHRRGVADARATRDSLQSVGEDFRSVLTARALSDFEELRKIVDDDLDLLEDLALQSRDPDSGVFRRNASLPFASSGARFFDLVSNRSLNDLDILRKVARSDINFVQMTILKGDPILTFIRDTAARFRFRPGTGKFRVPRTVPQVEDDLALVTWLCNQFDGGVLPEDNLVVLSLLEESKRDPELVVKLLSEAKELRNKEDVEQLRFEVIKALIYLIQLPIILFLMNT